MVRPWLAALLLASACGADPTSSTSSASDTTTTTGTTSATDVGTTDASSTSTSTAPTTTGDPPEPVCCGCLCRDPLWSCSAETCVDAEGRAVALVPEAGFLAVPAHEFAYDDGTEMKPVRAAEARHWYVFHPADDAPETRPLLVFFNGGPGFSTAILYGLNTGPRTADMAIAGDALVADNPHSWTQFANLLWIDPRETGYSYDVDPPGEQLEPAPFMPEHDAAAYLQVILGFLARHPQIEATPVVLVGESYGGLRASLIHQFTVHAGNFAQFGYDSPELHDMLADHEARIGDVAAQFAARVMIQPVIAWSEQAMHSTPEEQQMALQCVGDPDFSQCDQPFGWSAPYTDAVRAALTRPDTLAAMTGVDVTTIAWMYADARDGQHVRGTGGLDESALEAVFGRMPAGEDYYVAHFQRDTPPGYGYGFPRYALPFFRTLPFVRTFITDSGKDLVVFTPDFPAVIAAHGDFIAGAELDTAPVPGSPRPGQIHVTYRDGLGLADPTHTIRFPHYPGAGHMVTHLASPELRDDVAAWLAAP